MAFTEVTLQVGAGYRLATGEIPAGTRIRATPMVDMTNGVTVAAREVSIPLDSDGVATKTLYATTDPATTPAGNAYLFRLDVAGRVVREFLAEVPHDAGSTIDIDTLDELESPSVSLLTSVYQPLDDDLTAVAALGDGFPRRSGGSWTADSAAAHRAALGVSLAADVQTFTTAGGATWTKPDGVSTVHVALLAGGGGGGSGRRSAGSSAAAGGGGGAGGGWSTAMFPAAVLGSTEEVIVGAGGAGGAAPTTDDTNGNAGTAGIASLFGTNPTRKCRATGGSGGAAGTTSNGTAAAAGSGMSVGGNGAPGNIGTGVPSSSGAGSLACGAGGGGAGGGISAADVPTAGSAGGGHTYANSVGGAAGAVDTNGALATSTPASGWVEGGYGGGGGGASITTTGGSGADGAGYGSGGGGGGASRNGSNPGAGGAGKDGIVIVTSW